MLAPPADEQGAKEDPLPCLPPCWRRGHLVYLSTPKDQTKWEVHGSCHLLSGLVTVGPGGDNAGRAQDGRNMFQNPQMSAVFPPPQEQPAMEVPLWRSLMNKRHHGPWVSCQLLTTIGWTITYLPPQGKRISLITAIEQTTSYLMNIPISADKQTNMDHWLDEVRDHRSIIVLKVLNILIFILATCTQGKF